MRRLTAPLALLLSAALAAATAANGGEPAKASGQRGPGLQGPATDFLKLPVPRSFDLNHVEPAHFAEALGKDPERIFAFVRDHVAYEAYAGCLRGPRGTLLAMAGNSVDRAALLASLLENAGQRVRYAHGILPEAEAKELVLSMWAEHPRPDPPDATAEASPALKSELETLAAGVERDFNLIREHLKNAELPLADASGAGCESLIKEAQDHWWVQCFTGGKWVDMDPSFHDTVPGTAYARPAISDNLPADFFHRVVIRVRIEEYDLLLTGDAQAEPKTRDILSYVANSADLSGVDLVLIHVPENWTGPAENVQSALEAAIEDTGRVKPVLIVGNEKPIAGDPFRQKPPTGRGLGGVRGLLGGEGTRKAVPIATAMSLECEFLHPDGHKENSSRQIFDVVGMARRAAKTKLSADEVQECIKAAGAADVSHGIFSLLFTTGRLDAEHLAHVTDDLPSPDDKSGDEPLDARRFLRFVNFAFTITSDALLARVGDSGQTPVLFYPDSPRVQIVELSNAGPRERICLDLRCDHARAAVLDTKPESVRSARIFRGVVDGTLERTLIEFVTAGFGDEAEAAPTVMSTSSVLERARQDEIPTVLLTSDSSVPDSELPEDTLARLRAELTEGFFLVAPKQAVSIDDQPRMAWWQIDPRTGETIAMTDEGLHQTSTEYHLVHNRARGETTVVRLEYVGGRLVGHEGRTFAMATRRLGDYVMRGVAQGGRVFVENIRIY